VRWCGWRGSWVCLDAELGEDGGVVGAGLGDLFPVSGGVDDEVVAGAGEDDILGDFGVGAVGVGEGDAALFVKGAGVGAGEEAGEGLLGGEVGDGDLAFFFADAGDGVGGDDGDGAVGLGDGEEFVVFAVNVAPRGGDRDAVFVIERVME